MIGFARRWVSLLLCGCALAVPLPATTAPLILAPSSLMDGLNAVIEAYRTETGTVVLASYAGTPTVARQIEAGAPAQLVISADPDWMDYLEQRGLLVADTRINLLTNQLVLVSAADCMPRASGSLLAATLAQWLGPDGQLAMAHPRTVPAGRYGQAALSALGLWEGVAGRLVEVENVRLALKLAARGEVAAALVYRSDAIADPLVHTCYRFAATTHPTIRYPVAAVGRTLEPEVGRLLQFLSSPSARLIWEAHGFELLAGSQSVHLPPVAPRVPGSAHGIAR